MNAPVWFSNLLFWSAQAALLVLTGGLLRRVLQIQQPRIVPVYWRVLLGISLGLPFIQPWHRPESMEALTLPSANAGAPVVRFPDATIPLWHRPSLQLVAEIFGIVVLAGIAARFVILALGLLKLRQLRDHSSSVSPANTAANMSKPLFKIVGDGTGAERVNVKFGRASAQTIEMLDGLRLGDKVILSDMSDWEKYDRIHLK